jgi:hypothetical protein
VHGHSDEPGAPLGRGQRGVDDGGDAGRVYVDVGVRAGRAERVGALCV